MKSEAMLTNSNCASEVILYREYGYGSGTAHVHGDSGIIALDCDTWIIKSFEKTNSAALYISGKVDVTIPEQNYSGYISDFNPNCSGNLPTDYPFPSYPLNYFCVDTELVSPVFLSLANLEVAYGTVAVASISTIPSSSTIYSGLTLANGVDGILGFIDDNTPGSILDCSIKIGEMDKVTGQVSWQTDASLSLGWDGETLNVLSDTLPDTWSLRNITKQVDGNWIINVLLDAYGAAYLYADYSETNFCGIGSGVDIDNTGSLLVFETNCSEWRFRSSGIFPPKSTSNFILYSSFSESVVDYSFTNYNIVNSKYNIPDLPALFAQGTLPAKLKWIDDDKYPTWLMLDTESMIYSAVIVSCPVSGDCYFTSKYLYGYLSDRTQPQNADSPLTIMYGNLDENGIFLCNGQGQLVINFLDTGPVITATGLPDHLVFSSVVKQADSTWLATLTELIN